MSPLTKDRRELVRFSLAVRLVHAATAALLIVCIATAAILYNGSLAVFFGDRYVVEQVHVWCGFALPVPIIVGLVSRAYRLDLGRLNRFTSLDWKWLRSRHRRDGSIPVGKFNAGQKLNGALSAGAIGALLASGIVMYFTNVFRLSWRSGATFVHDWFALGLGLLVVGHVLYALRDPQAMTSMRTGRAPLRWARREHDEWAEEVAGADEATDVVP
ncbi:MAG TPA: cytochrome b/b6 domain-containing protein [Mycobacteriales bacterium]|jgi:formate dehydrogenase subunit gamma|nr:cytochrome b/b6 domain-containing protein [Mycobacteriales bacterium]